MNIGSCSKSDKAIACLAWFEKGFDWRRGHLLPLSTLHGTDLHLNDASRFTQIHIIEPLNIVFAKVMTTLNLNNEQRFIARIG